jgi:hypothetical protein
LLNTQANILQELGQKQKKNEKTKETRNAKSFLTCPLCFKTRKRNEKKNWKHLEGTNLKQFQKFETIHKEKLKNKNCKSFLTCPLHSIIENNEKKKNSRLPDQIYRLESHLWIMTTARLQW